MKNFRLLPFSILAAALIPLGLYLLITSSVLKKSIKTTVVNDPESGLDRSASALRNALAQVLKADSLAASDLVKNETLKKALLAPTPLPSAVKVFALDAAKNAPHSLFIITDGKGNVFYDNLDIPKPTPSPTPVASPVTLKTASKPKSTTKPKPPLLASIKDWPGMDDALAKTAGEGVLVYGQDYYLVGLAPVVSKEKTRGVVLVGEKIDNSLLSKLKALAFSDLIFYAPPLTYATNPRLAPTKEVLEKAFSGSRKFEQDHHSYLIGNFPLFPPAGVRSSGKASPVGTLYIFQPITQTQTAEGAPRKTILKKGLWIFLLALLACGWIFWHFMLPLDRLNSAIDRIKEGDLNASLPVQRPDEIGQLARSLEGMLNAIKEKDRISLILGKVVSPQMAKNILEARDLFALKGERRECTLLYADLRGFNTLSENMTPQALVEALNQYFGLINEIVFKHEGMLDKFIGDTAVAVWGAPFTHEDKEQRAVKAALEIQEALKDFNISRIKKGHPPFTIGTGIHTGMVVSGNLGSEKRYDYTIIGEPLHIVARLCAMAAPGQTVVSEETYQKIKQMVKANALNPIAIKGSMESLKTYEIVKLL